nr:hypothetical protein Iba_chr12bCG11070 [Ipomoea batatas]
MPLCNTILPSSDAMKDTVIQLDLPLGRKVVKYFSHSFLSPNLRNLKPLDLGNIRNMCAPTRASGVFSKLHNPRKTNFGYVIRDTATTQ